MTRVVSMLTPVIHPKITRKQLLALIRVEGAQNGKCTREALRLYVENNISFEKFNEALAEGVAIYHNTLEKKNEKRIEQ